MDFDIIVNNAGINDIHEIEDITDEEIERMIATNLVAPIENFTWIHRKYEAAKSTEGLLISVLSGQWFQKAADACIVQQRMVYMVLRIRLL